MRDLNAQIGPTTSHTVPALSTAFYHEFFMINSNTILELINLKIASKKLDLHFLVKPLSKEYSISKYSDVALKM